MIQEIDFQQFDVSERDGEEAGLKRHRLNLYTASKIVYLESVEDFSKEEESSWLQNITDTIEDSGKSVDNMIEPFKEPVRKMLELLELPSGLYRFALAFLRDTLDPEVDWRMIDNSDRYRWQLRYPRLTRLAKINSGDFELFAKKIRLFITMPDLTNPS